MKLLKNNKGKIASALIILIILAAAYFFDGIPKNDEKSDVTVNEQYEVLPQTEENEVIQENATDVVADVTEQTETDENSVTAEDITYEEEKTLEVAQENEEKAPEVIPEDEKKNVCSLSVRCDSIIQNIDILDKSKRGIIPSDGIIFEKQNAEFNEGESVFDVLLREMKNNRIHFEYVNTPMYNSVYIEGINNIYEFDCGPASGWLYKVNGEFPSSGCSQYLLKNNDVIEIVYTCNMGQDVGKN